tara:strand:- start:145 stop:357 length:213 start_codon:yes stop_codon:yes gene_type:complete
MSGKAKNIVEGFANLTMGANEQLKQNRLLICKGCEISEGTNWCLKKNGGCGCYNPAKASHADEECPEGKW